MQKKKWLTMRRKRTVTCLKHRILFQITSSLPPWKYYYNTLLFSKSVFLRNEVSWCLSGLRICHCHCYGSGYICGVGSIPNPGTSMCHGHRKKKKKKGITYLRGHEFTSYLSACQTQIEQPLFVRKSTR